MTNFAEFLDIKNMKKAFFGLWVCILASIFGCKDDNQGIEIKPQDADSAAVPAPIDTLGAIITQVQKHSRLYTAEYQVHKVVLFSDEARIGGKLIDLSLPGQRKVAIPIDVTLKGYVDFAEFSKSNVILNDSICIITLPDPKMTVTASRMDHEAIRQYVSMTRSKFSDEELNRLAAQGEDSIVCHIAELGIVERSRESCARTIVPFMARLGYKESNVIIRFRKKFDNLELRPITSSDK